MHVIRGAWIFRTRVPQSFHRSMERCLRCSRGRLSRSLAGRFIGSPAGGTSTGSNGCYIAWSPRREQRTATCGRPEAASRLEQARKFLEVAEMLEPVDTLAEGNVAGSLAVLAGIAAADAACCATLGRRSRAQDHKAALDLVRQVEPGGRDAAKAGPAARHQGRRPIWRHQSFGEFAQRRPPIGFVRRRVRCRSHPPGLTCSTLSY